MTRMGSAVWDVLGILWRVSSPRRVPLDAEGCVLALQQDQVHRFISPNPGDLVFEKGNGGYALLGKKCFALRIASAMGRNAAAEDGARAGWRNTCLSWG